MAGRLFAILLVLVGTSEIAQNASHGAPPATNG